MKRRGLLLAYYDAMAAALGPSRWWPGDTPFEIALGAILTQNTAWSNVEKAIANLRAAGLLSARELRDLPVTELEELIRPAGFFRIKAVRLRNFLNFLEDACDLDLERLRDADTKALRDSLLRVSGIGPETADSILLYALGHPTFVVDAYTRRIFHRHMLVPEDVGYEELRDIFMDALPPDATLFNEFHALIVRTGKAWCAKKEGKCRTCPLSRFLDLQGP
ncbi:endonuclease III domain-containing protein [Desulfomicrobium escambiense]|uniref:endonuclease III domain-containing protein n=1 Tax=Desulfomicrobium escambiense TaxID=29503 RepID=UPI000491FA8A|nr:endonuclease [Desulfomicrobium escambiense]